MTDLPQKTHYRQQAAGSWAAPPAGWEATGSAPNTSSCSLGTLTRANPALWPEEPRSFPSWGEAAARSGEDGERRSITEPSGAAHLFTLQTKATTRGAAAGTSHGCLKLPWRHSAASGVLDSPGPPARCLSGERGPEGEPGSLPFVTRPEEKAANRHRKALPRSGPETTWTDRISGPAGRSWCRRCTRPRCTAAPLQSVINKAARGFKRSKTSVPSPPGESHSSG